MKTDISAVKGALRKQGLLEHPRPTRIMADKKSRGSRQRATFRQIMRELLRDE